MSATPPAKPRPRWLKPVLASIAALVVCVPLACAGIIALVVRNERLARSYGPASLREVQPTLAPGVEVEIVPTHYSLQRARFVSFDVSPEGVLAGVTESGQLFDVIGGEQLAEQRGRIDSVAFSEGALAVTQEGSIGFWDDGAITNWQMSGIDDPTLASTEDGARLLVYSSGPLQPGRPALFDLRSEEGPRGLTGSPSSIDAAAGNSLATWYSTGSSLWRLSEPGAPLLLMKTPDGSRIEGVAVQGAKVFFSTDRAVYALEEGLAYPLVIGIGGRLRVDRSTLLVLDDATGRLFRVVLPLPGGATAASE